MKRQTIGEMRLETQLLAKRLRELPEGETITYADLSALAGVNVQNGARGLLMTAIRIVEKELKARFGTVRTVGIKRLPPDAWSGALSADRDHVRRASSRAFKRSLRIDWDRVPEEHRAAINGERTVLHFIAQAATDKKVARLTEAASAAGEAIGFDKTLEHFGK